LCDFQSAILPPIICRPSANFINAAKKLGSTAVSHCQFVPEIVQCAVNVFTYKTINQFDPSQAQITLLQAFAFTVCCRETLKIMPEQAGVAARLSSAIKLLEKKADRETEKENGMPKTLAGVKIRS